MTLMFQGQVKHSRLNKKLLYFKIIFHKFVYICPGDCFVILLLLESLLGVHYSRPMLSAGSGSGVELFQVFMCTGLWQDGEN